MTKRLFLLFVAFLLVNSVASAIQDVDCDTNNDRGNPLCQYKGIYKQPPSEPFLKEGDNNIYTFEEQDAFGAAGFYTELDTSGVEVSFGGGGMDWFGLSCDDPFMNVNCPSGVDITAVNIGCDDDYYAFSGDPCPYGSCKFIVDDSYSHRTKTRCNFQSTTSLGAYTVYFILGAYNYDAYNDQLVFNIFTDSKTYQLGCTADKGCSSGQTCVATETGTVCSGPVCECTSGDCCDGCNYYASNSQPDGKSDGYIGEKFCANNNVYQKYRNWYCTGSSATSTYKDTNKLVEICPGTCSNGACQPVCIDECDVLGTYCEGSNLITCSLGADGCKDKTIETCDETCWDKACRDYKLKFLFVPLGTEWKDLYQQMFNDAVQNQFDFFINEIPLVNCRDRVLLTIVDKDHSYDSFTCRNALSNLRKFVDKNTIYKSDDFDVVVGLIFSSPCSPIVGESNGKDTIWLTTAYEHNFAHEMGHIYGLEDEYCSNPAGSTHPFCNDGDVQGDGSLTGDINYLNPKSPFYCDPSEGGTCCEDGAGLPDCDPTVYPWSPRGYHICCRGNYNSKGGIATMSYADVHLTWSGERGYDDYSLAHLNSIPQLNCD